MIKNLLILLILSISFSCNERKPSSTNETNFYFAKKDIAEDVSLLLIGNICDDTQSSCTDWAEYDFQSLSGNNINATAKFLLTINKGVLEDTYVFEYGNRLKRRIYSAQEQEDNKLFKYIKLPKQFDGKLPRRFLNVSEVKRQRLPYSLLSYTFGILGFTPLSPYSETIKEIIKLIENKKVFQASYLARIVELAILDKKLPALYKYLGEEQLLSLGSALRIRYRGPNSSPTGTFGTSESERNEYYKTHLQYKTEVQSINMSKLIQRANEENLIVKVYTRDMAVLFYDPSKELHPTKYNSLLLNTSRSKKIVGYKEKLESPDKLIPLGVFIMSDHQQPSQVINFEKSKNPIREERLSKVLDYAVTIGISFISNGTLATAAKGANFLTKLVLKKSGRVYRELIIESEAHFRALVDAGVVELDSQEVSVDILLYFLENAGLDEDYLSHLRKQLKSSDKAIVHKAMQDVLKLFQSKQTSMRKISGLDQKYAVINRLYSTEKLKTLLNDNQMLEEIVRNLKVKLGKRKVRLAKKLERRIRRQERKDKRKAKRNPSATDSDQSAIVFMIDGLRPDRFKEAIGKGLMPNIKSYFIDKGIEFESFTTKSLTLPSWSSVLTGYDIDEHGVRSNGPMNRFTGKPAHNYIDPRKDLLSKKNRKVSRSLQHLKESGLKWLPDYFEKEEVITNYLPINAEAFPAVGKMIKILSKDYDKAIFGVFSGSVGLDQAGAMQTAKKIKKSPGKTKLILNWYTCVDVFAHHNNLAIDQCYRELDKTVMIVLSAAKEDPVLKDANLFIVSDHGHTGGHESKHSHYKLFEDGSYFNNTSLNLTTLLSGDFSQYSHFDFFTYTMETPHINNDLKFLNEYQLHPFKYKYKSKKKKYKGKKPNLMIDYSGDAMAQLYLKHPDTGWGQLLSHFQLTHFNERNLLEDILDVKVNNLVVYDNKTKKKLEKLTQRHPVMAYAHALSSCSQADIASIAGESFTSARPTIIIKGKGTDFGLILTQTKDYKLEYKYILVKDFIQDQNNKCTGMKLKKGQGKDVLESYQVINDQWITKIDFINKMRDTKFPTSIIALVANLTLAENIKDIKNRQAEIPDFILLPNLGFNFNSAGITEADHGNLFRREVNNSFFYSKMGKFKVTQKEKKKAKEKIVLNYFLTPFVLDVTQRHNTDSKKTWPSIFEYIRED